jgi:carbon-monoxide dehydrogenase large subunit
MDRDSSPTDGRHHRAEGAADRSNAAKGIGARLLRKEDARHLHGRATFVGDIAVPGLMEVAFLRSPLAHARIRSIRAPDALKDVVFTAADLTPGVKPVRTPNSTPGFKFADYPVLATGKVRMVGEPIAMCMATTRAEAEDLCQQVTVDLEELPAVIDVHEALRNKSVLVHEEFGDNVYMTTATDINFDKFASQAEVVVEREFSLARVCQLPLEGKGTLAYWDDRARQLVVYSSSQVPHIIRTALAEALRIEEGRVRVIAPDVGGGFGFKSVLQPEEIAIAWLALTRRQPVRWTEDRREHLTAAANAREHHFRVTAYADKRGRLLAIDGVFTVSVGAYSAWPTSAGLEALLTSRNFSGSYDFGGYRFKTVSVATNKPPMVPFRGVSKPGIGIAMELTLDALARTVGREPAEIRLENLPPPEAMPYTTVAGLHYDSGDYPQSMRLAIDKIGLAQVRARQKKGEPDSRLIGIGFSNYTETTALGAKTFAALGWPIAPGFEQASVRMTPDGGLEVRTGLQSPGVGLETTLAQVAHEILGIDPDDIQVVHGDTAITPYSTGTYNSRGMVMAGGAVSRATKVLAGRVKFIAAHILNCAIDEVRLVRGFALGPNGQKSIRDIARAWYLDPNSLPPDVDAGGLEATVGYKSSVDSGAIGYGTHAAVVAVDPETGEVEILDYVIVEDCGTVVNPMIVEGQAYGGTAQGIGQALYEEMPYDAAGQPTASTLADYLVPGAAEVPRIRVYHIEIPSPYTEFGAKGVGEGATIGAASVVMSAVNDALQPLGAEINDTPVTHRRVLEAIFAARARAQKSAAE